MTAPRAATPPATGTSRRPVGVTLVVVFGLLQAALVILVGVAMIVARDDPDVRASFDESQDTLLVVGIVVVLLGLVGGALALLLARGVDLVRSFLGILNTVEVAVAVYSLVALRDLRVGSVWALVLPVAVLWFLYGSEETQEFFER
jgi:hypothetical protein